MRKIVAVGVVIVVIALAAPALVVADERQTFERPTYAVGDTWVWEYVNRKDATNTLKITEVSETGFVGIDEANKRLEFDRDGNRIQPGWRWLPFPLHVGKKWKFDVQPAEEIISVEAQVKKFTTITTKAGTFETLLIESCWTRKNNTRCGFQVWYAPKVKRIVKRESPRDWRTADGDYALVSYTLAPH